MIEIDAELAREALRIAGQLEVKVRGGSMGPWIRSGDSVVVEPSADVVPGEILVFERDGQLIAHRVLRVVEGGWLTRGDSVARSDDVVRPAAAVGRVRGLRLRWIHLRHPPRWLRRTVGRLIAKTSPSLNRWRRRMECVEGVCSIGGVRCRRAAPRSPV